MSAVTVRGIVVRYANFKENDRILTLITYERGKVVASARGVRRPKSRLLSFTELFCYSTFDLFDYHDKYTVDDGQLEDSFFDLRMDVERLAYAAWVCELAEACMNEEEPNPPLFVLTLQTLTQLCYGKSKPRDIALVYAWQLMDILGYRPELENCVRCGDPLPDAELFDWEAGGICCVKCAGGQVYRISKEALQVLGMLYRVPMERIQTVTLPEKRMQEIRDLTALYLRAKLDRPFTPLREIERKWGLLEVGFSGQN